ncbi:ECF RNA polymerase sigma factor SigK [Promicromonospora sp. NPDC057488]|uniref:ECF RNA polymerase sigma factor SigK n=1 Tax=Promicromonospora sp. NPDC057488 TaxID=3346147 RepID=UPI00366AD292
MKPGKNVRTTIAIAECTSGGGFAVPLLRQKAFVRQTEAVASPHTRNSPHDTVDALLVACAGGDPASFTPVYDVLSPVAYGASLGVLRDPDHAAEVTQEVMVEVWQTAARFDSARGSARTWVATLARRRAVDRVRSEQARRDRDQRDTDLRTNEVARDTVVEDVERRLEGSAVRRCIGGLTPTQREAVVVAYYGGLTYREVAERLDKALPTVKSRIRDGLNRLRDCLGVRHV